MITSELNHWRAWLPYRSDDLEIKRLVYYIHRLP